MGFYESEWVDRFGIKRKVIIPYSEIIAYEIQYYDQCVYTPVLRKECEYRSKIGEEGESDYLKWIDYMNNK